MPSGKSAPCTEVIALPRAAACSGCNHWVGAQDGTQKMSKSAESDISRINLLDEPKLLTKKIRSAKTDTFEGLEWDDPNRPEARNLLNMYSLATGASKVPCHTPLRTPACHGSFITPSR